MCLPVKRHYINMAFSFGDPFILSKPKNKYIYTRQCFSFDKPVFMYVSWIL